LVNDTETFERMLGGDEKSLGILLSKYHNYLVVVGLRYLSDRQRVDDVIHDAFADLWNSQKDVSINTEVKFFLRGVVINKCLAIIRKDNRMDYVDSFDLQMVDKAPTPDQILDANQLQAKIDSILEQLPEKCRQVFLLSRREGKSHKEIAALMDISTKTIENHMSRALRTFREQLKGRQLYYFLVIMMMQ